MRRAQLIGLAVSLLLTVLACGARQNINRASGIRPGMSPEDVTRVMGADPVRSEFSDGILEWHYCRTGFGEVDQFVAFFFVNDSVIESRNYSVTLRDTGGAIGSCVNFIKMGTYEEPDRVTEIRVR